MKHRGKVALCFLTLTVCVIKGDVNCSPEDKSFQCPPGYRDDGLSCWKESYGRGGGRIPDKSPCKQGQRDDGTSCWIDSYGRGVGRAADKTRCPHGLRDDGTSCWNDAHIYGKGCCCTLWGCCNRCPSGYKDDGCTCRKTNVGIKRTLFQRLGCKSTEDKYGSRCYPKCKLGYRPIGCCICEPRGGPRLIQNLKSRQSCRMHENMYGGLCYPKCREGYKQVGCCVCEPEGGPGIKKNIFQRLNPCVFSQGINGVVEEIKNAVEKTSQEMIDKLNEKIIASLEKKQANLTQT